MNSPEPDAVTTIPRPLRSRRKMARLIVLACALMWLPAVCLGLWILWGYENRPGAGADAPRVWPADAMIRLAPDRDTLIMLVHPHCPCTRASIGELAALMAHCQGKVAAHVLFLKPDGFSDDWEKTDLWQSAAAIPGVTTVVDRDGAGARLFHAATSGQTMLYDTRGRLVFSGGITSARGHYGDNAGESAIISLANTGAADRTKTEVYGCPLFDPDSECHKENHANKEH